ncbi:MAG: YdcF family protein [Coriobacteriia bacterium]|nr:YdcF family protein [Coriobacteriia bacterium]
MVTGVLSLAVAAALIYVVATAVSIWTYSFTDETKRADAAIVLGAAVWDDQPSPIFEQRINHAIWLYRHQYVDTLIMTGGIPADAQTQYTEASVARDYAIEHGVKPDSILIEEVSTKTQENIAYAAELTREHGIDTVLIVTDPLHMKRGIEMARDTHLEAYASPARTTAFQTLRTKIPFLFKEVFYLISYRLFG